MPEDDNMNLQDKVTKTSLLKDLKKKVQKEKAELDENENDEMELDDKSMISDDELFID